MTELDQMFENCKMYYPFLEEGVTSYTDEHQPYGCLLIKYEDGTAVVYDDIDRAFRRLRYKPDEMTEEQFRADMGRRLRDIMRAKGISQDLLSAATGISQPMISNYVRGKATPSAYALDIIAKALNCSMDDFRYF